jgi:hypothetical protein
VAAAIEALMRSTIATCAPRGRAVANGIFEFLINASSCVACAPFYRDFGEKQITFLREMAV